MISCKNYENRVARIMTKSSYDASADPLLDMLGWDRVSVSRTKAVIMFKTLNKLAPSYMQDVFSARRFPY